MRLMVAGLPGRVARRGLRNIDYCAALLFLTQETCGRSERRDGGKNQESESWMEAKGEGEQMMDWCGR